MNSLTLNTKVFLLLYHWCALLGTKMTMRADHQNQLFAPPLRSEYFDSKCAWRNTHLNYINYLNFYVILVRITFWRKIAASMHGETYFSKNDVACIHLITSLWPIYHEWQNRCIKIMSKNNAVSATKIRTYPVMKSAIKCTNRHINMQIK